MSGDSDNHPFGLTPEQEAARRRAHGKAGIILAAFAAIGFVLLVLYLAYVFPRIFNLKV